MEPAHPITVVQPSNSAAEPSAEDMAELFSGPSIDDSIAPDTSVIIGGGPAGMGVLLQAARMGILHEVLP